MSLFHFQSTALFVLLMTTGCTSSRSGPGPSCLKLIEVIRASCAGNGPVQIRRENCEVVEAMLKEETPQVEWDSAETACEVERRGLEELPSLKIDQSPPRGRHPTATLPHAMTYKFRGALHPHLQEPDATAP